MENRFGKQAQHLSGRIRCYPGNQHHLIFCQQPFQDTADLHGGFADPENHLRKAVSQAAVMIHMGVPHGFKRKMGQLIGRIVDRLVSAGDIRQNFF